MLTIYLNIGLLVAAFGNLAVALWGLRCQRRLRKVTTELQQARDRFYELVDAGKVEGYTSSRRIVEATITTPKLGAMVSPSHDN